MVATFEWKVQAGTDPGTENPAGSATNCNYMDNDSYDSTDTQYQDYPIAVPESGTAYSYERFLRGKWSGTFNSITSMAIWHSSGAMVDTELDLAAGVTTVYGSPVKTASAIATLTLGDWDESGESFNIQTDTSLTSEGYSKYLVQQLRVSSAVTTPGDIGTQQLTLSYYEE